MTGRAMLFHGPGQACEERTVEVPPLQDGEVLVRVACCTLCSSDLHTHAGRRAVPTPMVLGHEIVGRIESTNHEWHGERVTWTVAASCHACPRCDDGIPQKCEKLIKYGHRRTEPHAIFTGGLADFVILVPGTGIVRVPHAVADPIAAMASCATATVAAAMRAAGGVEGKRVHIVGAGVLGVTACAWARAYGAKMVTVSDPDADRMARAGQFGASGVAMTADVVLEFAGTAAAVEQAVEMADVDGSVVLVGSVLPVGTAKLDPERIVRRMLTIRGMHNYRHDDLTAAVNFLAGPGRAYPFESLIGPSFKLADIEQAFAHAHQHAGTRVVVNP